VGGGREPFQIFKTTQTNEFKQRFEFTHSKQCTSMYATVHHRSTAAPAVHQGINGHDPPAPLVKVDRNGQQSLSSVILYKPPVVLNITTVPFHL
jgi:hypothetical protein